MSRPYFFEQLTFPDSIRIIQAAQIDGSTQPRFTVPIPGSAMNIRALIAISIFLIALPAAAVLNRTAAGTAPIEVPRISIEQANRMHGNPDVIFIDVRTARSWWRSTSKIARAIREEPAAVEQWAPKYSKNNIFILYCT